MSYPGRSQIQRDPEQDKLLTQDESTDKWEWKEEIKLRNDSSSSARCTSYLHSIMYSNAIFIIRRTCVQGQTLIITSLLSKMILALVLEMLASQRAVLKSNLRKPTWLTLMSHGPFIIARTSPPTVLLLLLLLLFFFFSFFRFCYLSAVGQLLFL